MAEFLTTNGISYHIENVILKAKNKLVLLSPYLQISKTFYERLKDTANKGVIIKIIYGKDKLHPNERNSLSEIKNIELYFFENLHAKCYFNEKEMVITSMNMYEYSEKNNREMGVFITKEKDPDLFSEAVNETMSIVQSAERIEYHVDNRRTSRKNDLRTVHYKSSIGFCIRCNYKIPLDRTKPFCEDCFFIWIQFENLEYEENFCHECGESEATSMLKPLCYNCFISG